MYLKQEGAKVGLRIKIALPTKWCEVNAPTQHIWLEGKITKAYIPSISILKRIVMVKFDYFSHPKQVLEFVNALGNSERIISIYRDTVDDLIYIWYE